ncbi:Rv3654c family TadE-like protein [Microbacterium sp.]|uniref:Rv3654c family TadE-like protein n=1 Tax=Microbacterium sp. TaxID=51671 RepID=UPI003A87C2F2
MAGSVLAVGVLAVGAVIATGYAAAGAVSVATVRVAGVADAAALAAADTAAGRVPGVPCARADDLARAGGAVLTGCDVDGVEATVTVAMRVGAVTVTGRARAGPPR